MKPRVTQWKSAFKFHTTFFQTKLTITGLTFILYDFLKDILLSQILFKLNLKIDNLNYIILVLPKLKRTRHVT